MKLAIIYVIIAAGLFAQATRPNGPVIGGTSVYPAEGPGYAPNRAAVINSSGQIEAAAGTVSNCLHVDGGSAPCPGVGSGSGVTTFKTRTGDVVAVTGDYTAAQVTNAVDSSLMYTDPSWLASLSPAKVGVAVNQWNASKINNQLLSLLPNGLYYFTSGVPTAITGNPSDCIHVDGSSAVCGSGGGGGPNYPTLTLDPVSNLLIWGANCSPVTPCRAQIGNQVYSYLGSATISAPQGTGGVYVYFDAAGNVRAGHNLTSLACVGCFADGSVSNFPPDATPMYGPVSVFLDVFSAPGPSLQVAVFGQKTLTAGTNASVTDTASDWTVSSTGGAGSGGVVNTRGAVGAGGSLAPTCNGGAAGLIYTGTDSNFVGQCDGSSYWWSAFGVSGITIPTTGQTTWLNQGGATLTQAGPSLVLTGTVNVNSSPQGRRMAVPATPYTQVGCFIESSSYGYSAFGMFWTDDTYYEMVQMLNQPASASPANQMSQTFMVDRNNSFSNSAGVSFSHWVSLGSATFAGKFEPLCIGLVDDGTNKKVGLSRDGSVWFPQGSETHTNFITPTKIGFFLDANTNATTPVTLQIFNWKTYPSALF